MRPRPEPRPYDFAHPYRLGQDQVRALRALHQAFTRAVAVTFSARLRTLVDVAVVSIGQSTYGEAVAAGHSPTACFVAGQPDGPARLLLDMDPRLVVFLSERLFGGQGGLAVERRELSRIEERVGVRLAEHVFEALEEAWEPHAALHLPVERFEREIALAQLDTPDALVVVVRLEASVGRQTAPLALIYPLALIEQVFGPPTARPAVRPGEQPVPEPLRACYEATVRTTEVPLACELGRTRLTLDELMALRPGDVIPLPTRPGDALVARVGGQARFRVAAGRSGSRAALRILDVLNPESADAPRAA